MAMSAAMVDEWTGPRLRAVSAGRTASGAGAPEVRGVAPGNAVPGSAAPTARAAGQAVLTRGCGRGDAPRAVAPDARAPRPGGPGARVGLSLVGPRCAGPSSAAAARATLPTPPVAAGRLRLTRRGVAVILGFFVLAMVASVVMVLTSFLAVSNDPIGVSW